MIKYFLKDAELTSDDSKPSQVSYSGVSLSQKQDEGNPKGGK